MDKWLPQQKYLFSLICNKNALAIHFVSSHPPPLLVWNLLLIPILLLIWKPRCYMNVFYGDRPSTINYLWWGRRNSDWRRKRVLRIQVATGIAYQKARVLFKTFSPSKSNLETYQPQGGGWAVILDLFYQVRQSYSAPCVLTSLFQLPSGLTTSTATPRSSTTRTSLHSHRGSASSYSFLQGTFVFLCAVYQRREYRKLLRHIKDLPGLVLACTKMVENLFFLHIGNRSFTSLAFVCLKGQKFVFWFASILEKLMW